MQNLSLTTKELDRINKIFAFGVTILACIFAAASHYLFSSTDSFFMSVLRAISPAFVAMSLVFVIFVRWGWKIGIISSLFGRVVVSGTWLGHLTSDYEGKRGQRIPIVFVVRQTYLTVSIQSFTATQEGESSLEALISDVKFSARRLSYVFELRKPYLGTDRLTKGAGQLKFLDKGNRLKGSYWTGSPTQGEIELYKVSDDVDAVERFDDALRKWPLGKIWCVEHCGEGGTECFCIAHPGVAGPSVSRGIGN